jgi:hypothetical protein
MIAVFAALILLLLIFIRGFGEILLITSAIKPMVLLLIKSNFNVREKNQMCVQCDG